MSTIDQKAYLKKYLAGSATSSGKKKKKRLTKGNGLKIIDDDLDLSKLRPLDGDELDILGQGEDAPQIAGIIDERPEELRQLEDFKVTSKWRVINQDDGFNSKLQVEEIQQTVTETAKENTLIFGKMYSDSEDEKRDSDLSPPRKSAKLKEKQPKSQKSKPQSRSDSDFSPPRKSAKLAEKSHITHRNQPQSHSDSDFSPPRKSAKLEERPSKSQRNKRQSHNDSDFSPPRKSASLEEKSSKSQRNKRQSHNDRDFSPPRKLAEKSSKSQKNKPRSDSDSDISPPRRDDVKKLLNKAKNDKKPSRWSNIDEEIPKSRHRSPSLDISPPRQKSDSKHTKPVTISRRKRETSEERRKKIEKAERQKVLDEKYQKWGKGLKQMEDQERRVQDYLQEASKPLARGKDDRDLEGALKAVERDGDPMLNYMREKNKMNSLLPVRPTYKGSWMPNRFNIRPGYRWDGVDRSNGYEKKLFDHQSSKKAQQEEVYKWSTEDL